MGVQAHNSYIPDSLMEKKKKEIHSSQTLSRDHPLE